MTAQNTGLQPTTLDGWRAVIGPPGPRGLSPHRCRRCHAIVLSGLDADMMALHVDIDPVPVSGLGELQAVMQKRWTYQVRRSGRHTIATRRGRHFIAHRRPGGRDWRGPYDVVAEHRCGTLALPVMEPRVLRIPPPPVPESGICPF